MGHILRERRGALCFWYQASHVYYPQNFTQPHQTASEETAGAYGEKLLRCSWLPTLLHTGKLAGREGIEPSSTVLETAVLPLHHRPMTGGLAFRGRPSHILLQLIYLVVLGSNQPTRQYLHREPTHNAPKERAASMVRGTYSSD